VNLANATIGGINDSTTVAELPLNGVRGPTWQLLSTLPGRHWHNHYIDAIEHVIILLRRPPEMVNSNPKPRFILSPH